VESMREEQPGDWDLLVDLILSQAKAGNQGEY
jgi:hypothetical protein